MRPDNRIIAEAKRFSSGMPQGVLSVLTDDTIALLIAEAHGVSAQRQSPPNGFCQGDRTKKDKKIREQEEKIKFLSNAFASASLGFFSAAGEEINQLPVTLTKYRKFTRRGAWTSLYGKPS